MNLIPHLLTPAEIKALTLDTFDLANIFDHPEALAPPQGAMLVIRDAGKIVASAAYRQTAPKACEIDHFVVSYAYRGKGLGSRLMRALLNEARQAGYTRITSQITPWCPEWRAFYKAYGFEYVHPEDESNMTGTVPVELELA